MWNTGNNLNQYQKEPLLKPINYFYKPWCIFEFLLFWVWHWLLRINDKEFESIRDQLKPYLQTSWSFDTYNMITKYVCHLCKVLPTYDKSLSILRKWLIYFRWAIDCHIGRHKFQKGNTKRHRTFISTGFITN